MHLCGLLNVYLKQNPCSLNKANQFRSGLHTLTYATYMKEFANKCSKKKNK